MTGEQWITTIIVLGGIIGMALVVRPLIEDVRELIRILRTR